MTDQEELRYLSDLLLQASRWERSEGEVLSGLELEVQDRIRRLTGVETVDENGMAQSVVERGLAKAAAKSGQRHGQLRPGYHRVSINGKKLTLHESQLEKVEYKCSPTGYRWVPKPGVVPDAPENE
jgi:hypothetical protein